MGDFRSQCSQKVHPIPQKKEKSHLKRSQSDVSPKSIVETQIVKESLCIPGFYRLFKIHLFERSLPFFCKSAMRRQPERGRKSKLYVSLLDHTHGRGIRTPCWKRYEAQDNKKQKQPSRGLIGARWLPLILMRSLNQSP